MIDRMRLIRIDEKTKVNVLDVLVYVFVLDVSDEVMNDV